MAAEIYEPLTREGEIRILRLEPGAFQDEIRGELMLAAVDNVSPDFTALSYAWGDGPADVSISINGSPFYVRNNLGMALRRLRSKSEYTATWVDAICINQYDLEERSQQVGIMRHIYKAASQVAIYLGEVIEGTQEALIRIFQLSKMSKDPNPNLLELPQLAHEWKHFQDFYSRSWFKRLWVLQEVAVSTNDPMVICGQYYISWKYIRDAARFFYKSGLVRTTRRRDIAWNVVLMSDCKEIPNALSLLSLLQRTVLFEATDPSDRLFALYGLAQDMQNSQSRSIFRIDYSISVKDLYRQFTRNYIEFSGKSNILTMERGVTCLNNLPSWVPDLSSPTPNSALGASGFKDARYLSLYPGAEFRLPYATDDYKASLWHNARLDDSNDPNVLSIAGSIADKVVWISEPFENEVTEHLPAGRKPGFFVRLWSEVFRQLKSATSLEKLQESFWRTLISNVTDSKEPAPDAYYTHFLCFWHEKQLLDLEAQRYAAANPETLLIDDPDVYGSLQYEHITGRKLTKQLAAGIQRLWHEARAKHPEECTGCNLCCSGLYKAEKWLDLKHLPRPAGDDPMLEFEDSDCFIKEYFRRLREDFTEPLPIILGSAQDFCTPNMQAMLNRCFFITEKGRMGIGPRRMRPSDVVTIISGASLPLILRKVDGLAVSDPPISGETDIRLRYGVIGPAYVHGLMNGEGVPEPIVRDVPEFEGPVIKELLVPEILHSLLGPTIGDAKVILRTYPWEILDLV